MQEIQPELNAFKEKYKSKDAVTQQKYRKEMQKVMTERKINPAAGCLPVIIQMPILIGFYHAISRMNVTKSKLVNYFGLNLLHRVLHLQFLQELCSLSFYVQDQQWITRK